MGFPSIFGLLLTAFMLNQASAQDNRATTITVASILNEPFLMQDNETKEYFGFIPDLLDEITTNAGVSYELKLPSDNKYGSYDPNSGRWTGLMGMIQQPSSEADLIAADLTLSGTRLDAADFTPPFLSVPIVVLMKDSPLSYSLLPIFGPFSLAVWILIIISFLVTALILWFVSRLAPEENFADESKPAKEVHGLLGAIWYLFSFFFRGSDYSPKALSVRLIIAVWWLVSVVFLTLYVLGLAANAGVYGRQPRPTTIGELVDNPNFQFSVISGGSTENSLRTSNNPHLQAIYDNIAAGDAFAMSMQEGMDMLKEKNPGSFGFLIEETMANMAASQDCSLIKVGRLMERQQALAFRKGHQRMKTFSKELIKMQTNGKLDALKDKWFKENACSLENNGGFPVGASGLYVTFNHIWHIFVILAAALIVSLLLGFLEALICGKRSGIAFKDRLKKAFTCSSTRPEAHDKQQLE